MTGLFDKGRGRRNRAIREGQVIARLRRHYDDKKPFDRRDHEELERLRREERDRLADR